MTDIICPVKISKFLGPLVLHDYKTSVCTLPSICENQQTNAHLQTLLPLWLRTCVGKLTASHDILNVSDRTLYNFPFFSVAFHVMRTHMNTLISLLTLKVSMMHLSSRITASLDITLTITETDDCIFSRSSTWQACIKCQTHSLRKRYPCPFLLGKSYIRGL